MPPKPFHLPDIASKTGDRKREVRGLKRAMESHTKDLRWARIGRDNQSCCLYESAGGLDHQAPTKDFQYADHISRQGEPRCSIVTQHNPM